MANSPNTIVRSKNLILFEQALVRYRNAIQKKPSKTVQTLLCQSDLIREIKDAQATGRTQGVSWKLDSAGWLKLSPFLDSLSRFSSAIDTFVQFNPSPASLIWGGIKLLIRVCLSL